MTNSLYRILVLWGFILSGSSTAVHAEQQTLKAMIPWDGEGRVFQVNTGTMLFLGALEGIIYVETSTGKLDEGFVRCPVKQEVDQSTRATVGSGHCMITASGGDTVFAQWTCTGKVGICRGDFKITGGTGEFEGITGSSDLVIRSPLRSLVTNMSSGSVLRVASGIAVLPELQYEIPKKR